MTPVLNRWNRGSALLFVLAALALVVPVCLGLARAVATSALDRELRRDEQVAIDLLREANAPIVAWLTKNSATIVLRPDSPYPAVLVLDEHLRAEDKELALRIVAWDQCGLTPIAIATGASAFRLTLPREIIETLERRRRSGELPGLDWFTGFTDNANEGPFPPAPNVQQIDGGTSLVWPHSAKRVIGAWIAMHNTARLNVSTAPVLIIEAALRDLGRGGIDRIVLARRKGEQAPIPPAGTNQQPDDASQIELVSTSDCWAFRVDLGVGHVSRSFFLTYRRGESSEGGWRCVQRLLVTNA